MSKQISLETFIETYDFATQSFSDQYLSSILQTEQQKLILDKNTLELQSFLKHKEIKTWCTLRQLYNTSISTTSNKHYVDESNLDKLLYKFTHDELNILNVEKLEEIFNYCADALNGSKNISQIKYDKLQSLLFDIKYLIAQKTFDKENEQIICWEEQIAENEELDENININSIPKKNRINPVSLSSIIHNTKSHYESNVAQTQNSGTTVDQNLVHISNISGNELKNLGSKVYGDVKSINKLINSLRKKSDIIRRNKVNSSVDFQNIACNVNKSEHYFIFSPYYTSSSIKQGIAGDCSLISALAAIVNYENQTGQRLLHKNIYPKNSNNKPILSRSGIYAVKLNISNKLLIVFVDDLVPVNGERKPLLSAGTGENEFWVTIYSKAFMKLNKNLRLGNAINPANEIYHILGFPFEIESITRDIEVNYKAKLWTQLYNQFNQSRILLTIGTTNLNDQEYCNDKGDTFCLKTGLIRNHAYPVLDMFEVDGLKLFKVRNTWGKCGSKKNIKKYCYTVSKSILMSCKYFYDIHDEAIFLINFDLVVKYFSYIYINWNVDFLSHQLVAHLPFLSYDSTKDDNIPVELDVQYPILNRQFIVSVAGPSPKAVIFIVLAMNYLECSEKSEVSVPYKAFHVSQSSKINFALNNCELGNYSDAELIMQKVVLSDHSENNQIISEKNPRLCYNQSEALIALNFKNTSQLSFLISTLKPSKLYSYASSLRIYSSKKISLTEVTHDVLKTNKGVNISGHDASFEKDIKILSVENSTFPWRALSYVCSNEKKISDFYMQSKIGENIFLDIYSVSFDGKKISYNAYQRDIYMALNIAHFSLNYNDFSLFLLCASANEKCHLKYTHLSKQKEDAPVFINRAELTNKAQIHDQRILSLGSINIQFYTLELDSLKVDIEFYQLQIYFEIKQSHTVALKAKKNNYLVHLYSISMKEFEKNNKLGLTCESKKRFKKTKLEKCTSIHKIDTFHLKNASKSENVNTSYISDELTLIISPRLFYFIEIENTNVINLDVATSMIINTKLEAIF